MGIIFLPAINNGANSHNHNLADLNEKDYYSLDNLPDLNQYALKSEILNPIKKIPVTIANCENTTNETAYWDTTLQPNEWLDQEMLKVESLIVFQNGGSGNASLRLRLYCNEIEQYNQLITVSGSTLSKTFRIANFIRTGNSIYYNGVLQTHFNTGSADNFSSTSGGVISTVDFNQAVRLKMTATWSVAATNIYFRNLITKILKY